MESDVLRVIQDNSLSLNAKGLYLIIKQCIAYNSGNCSRELIKNKTKSGEHAIKNAIHELKENELLLIEQTRDVNGRIDYDWRLFG